MRTTIRLDDDLLRQAKTHAARTGKTLTAVISDALRESFGRSNASPRRRPVRVPVVSGRGLARGVDLDDSAALLDLMEQRPAAR